MMKSMRPKGPPSSKGQTDEISLELEVTATSSGKLSSAKAVPKPQLPFQTVQKCEIESIPKRASPLKKDLVTQKRIRSAHRSVLRDHQMRNAPFYSHPKVGMLLAGIVGAFFIGMILSQVSKIPKDLSKIQEAALNALQRPEVKSGSQTGVTKEPAIQKPVKFKSVNSIRQKRLRYRSVAVTPKPAHPKKQPTPKSKKTR